MSGFLRLGGKFFKPKRFIRLRNINENLNFNELSDTSSSSTEIFNESLTERPPPININDNKQSPESTEESWKTGRRIVELDHMAKQMGCTDCGKTLSLTNIVDEVRHGFASTLTIDCECGTINNITTGKSHRVSKRGPAVFDINSKAALGMIHSGSGHTQVINFMSSLEIEGLHHKTMKKREREVETSVQTVAMQSCKDAIAKEIELEREISHTLGEMNDTPGQFKYDMGWQKRGSGRAYDSKSGVGTLIGNRSGKICAYGIRSKVCRKCSFHNNQGQIPPKHECKKNWAGSSKAMESNVAIEVINQVEEENIQVSVPIMDDDCTTMARINENISHPVEKWSDINHTRKHLGNSLYDLIKKHKNFTTKCVQFIQKKFSYALAQNKDDPIRLKKSSKSNCNACVWRA